MGFSAQLQRSYRGLRIQMKKIKKQDTETVSPQIVNFKAIVRDKIFLTFLVIIIIGNTFGLIFMIGVGDNPNHLGTLVYSKESHELRPNSTYYYSAYLNASKNSITFKSDINVEYYLVDVALNESDAVPLSAIKEAALYGDNDARGFTEYLSEKKNYTLVIVTHIEKTTSFECTFKEYTIAEQEEMTYYTVGKWLLICSFIPMIFFLMFKVLIPWIQTKNVVFWTLYSHEVKLGFQLWIQKLWILVVVFASFSNVTAIPGVEVVASVLFLFVFFGTMIAALPASSSISGEIGGIADSLLSKSVRRWQYLLSKFFSQYTIILVIYLATFLAIIGLKVAVHQFPTNLDYEQLFIIIGLVGMSLVLFATFGVLFSVLFSKPLFAIIGNLVIWFFFIFMMENNSGWNWAASPVTVLQNFENILLNLWPAQYWKIFLFYFGIQFSTIGVATVAFYKKDL